MQDWLDEKAIGWIIGALVAAGAVLYRVWMVLVGMKHKGMFSNGDMECLQQLATEVHQWRESMQQEILLWREEMTLYRKASEEQNRVVHGNSKAMNDLRTEITHFRVELSEMKGRIHDL